MGGGWVPFDSGWLRLCDGWKGFGDILFCFFLGE